MEIAKLREFCLNLPGTHEEVKWGNDLCFMVGGKMFCVTGFEPGAGITVKVPDEEFDEICELPGIAPAHYVGRYKWITAAEPNRFSDKEWERMISRSYELIVAKLPKRLRPGAN